MRKFCLFYQVFLDKVEKVVVFVTAFLMALLLCNVLVGIFFDSFVGSSITWTEEVSILLISWVCFLGAGAIARYGGHIGVTSFLEWLPIRFQFLVRMCHVFLAIILVIVMVHFGRKMAFFVGRYQTSVYLDLSMFYYYLSIPVGGLLLGLNTIGTILPDRRNE